VAKEQISKPAIFTQVVEPPNSRPFDHFGTTSTGAKSRKHILHENGSDAQYKPSQSSQPSAGDSSPSFSGVAMMTTPVSPSKPPNVLFADPQRVVESHAIDSQNRRRMHQQASLHSSNILKASGWTFATTLTFVIFMTFFCPPVAVAQSCPGSSITAAPFTGPFHIGTSPVSADQSTLWAASTDSWSSTAAAPCSSTALCRPSAAQFHLVEIVVTLNIDAPAVWPSLLLPVMHNGITFQAPFACAPPYFFIGPSGMCIMGSTSAVIFAISPSDRIAGNADATLTMIFLPVISVIFSGCTITLVPASNFASSIAPVVSASASSVPGMFTLCIACGAASSTAVVLTTSGATINASAAAFTIQKPAASGSTFVFLTGIVLSLLVAGMFAQFISLPLVAVQLNDMVYLTVRAPPFCLLRLLLQ